MQVLSVRGAQKSASGSSCVVQTHDGDGLDGHRVSRTHDSEICFTSCARSKVGLRAGPATPHRNRAYGHETSPQRGCCSPVRCLDRRPQAQGAPNTTARPRWSHGTRFEIFFAGYGYVTTQDGTSRSESRGLRRLEIERSAHGHCSAPSHPCRALG